MPSIRKKYFNHSCGSDQSTGNITDLLQAPLQEWPRTYSHVNAGMEMSYSNNVTSSAMMQIIKLFSAFYSLERKKCGSATSAWGQRGSARCLFIAVRSCKSDKLQHTPQTAQWAYPPKCKFLILLYHQKIYIYIFSNLFIPVFVTCNIFIDLLYLQELLIDSWPFSSFCTTKKSAGSRKRATSATAFKTAFSCFNKVLGSTGYCFSLCENRTMMSYKTGETLVKW